jgi:hypothetical protein
MAAASHGSRKPWQPPAMEAASQRVARHQHREPSVASGHPSAIDHSHQRKSPGIAPGALVISSSPAGAARLTATPARVSNYNRSSPRS